MENITPKKYNILTMREEIMKEETENFNFKKELEDFVDQYLNKIESVFKDPLFINSFKEKVVNEDLEILKKLFRIIENQINYLTEKSRCDAEKTRYVIKLELIKQGIEKIINKKLTE
jgi:hypothetical protein